MTKELKIKIAVLSAIVLILLGLTYYLNGLYSSIIFHTSILITFCILFYRKKKKILLVPIIASFMLIDILTIHFYLESPWWYSLLLFPIAVLFLLINHIVKLVKHDNKRKENQGYLILCIVYIGIIILYGASITFTDFLPIADFTISKESTFFLTMILNFSVIEAVGLIELLKSR